jgi:hypothetical protein
LKASSIFVGQDLNSRRSHYDVDIFVDLWYLLSDEVIFGIEATINDGKWGVEVIVLVWNHRNNRVRVIKRLHKDFRKQKYGGG